MGDGIKITLEPMDVGISHAREVMDIRERESAITHRQFAEASCDRYEAISVRNSAMLERVVIAEEKKVAAYERIAIALERALAEAAK